MPADQPRLDFGAENEPDLRGMSAWAPQQWPISADWQALVDRFLASEPGRHLAQFITSRLERGAVIYPTQPFWSLELTPLSQVRVVILGQDPYHGAGQAQGLAFSVPSNTRTPPSLRNIFKEIERDPLLGRAGSTVKNEVSLVPWAQQGVLLLNTVLTVEEAQPASHAGRGWEHMTDEIVRAIARKKTPVVFMLWGKHAQSKINLIESAQAELKFKKIEHLVLMANHPSPLSAARQPTPFLGCGHFSKTNDFLVKHGEKAIDWSVGENK